VRELVREGVLEPERVPLEVRDGDALPLGVSEPLGVAVDDRVCVCEIVPEGV